MTGLTKQAIRNSCIKLLNEKPLFQQVTVKDIVNDCGINRNSFYYHYQDLPSLIEEIVTEEADRLIDAYPKIDSIEEGLYAAISFALENKKVVLHIYHSVNREIYEQYLWRICEHVSEAYINSAFSDYEISAETKQAVIRLNKCECFGMIMDWLSSGMSGDIMDDIKRICDMRRGMTTEMFKRSGSEKSDK